MKDATDSPQGDVDDIRAVFEDLDNIINRENLKKNMSRVATKPFEERNVECPFCGVVLDENTWKGFRIANSENPVYEGLDPLVLSVNNARRCNSLIFTNQI